MAGAIAPTAMPDGTYHKVQPQQESATRKQTGSQSGHQRLAFCQVDERVDQCLGRGQGFGP